MAPPRKNRKGSRPKKEEAQPAPSQPAAPEATRQSHSPVSSGNVGVEFENPVAAYYLALALLHAVPRGQFAGTTQEVRFQQRFSGEPLDDLVVVSQVPTASRQLVLPRLSLQLKRDLHLTEKNSTFDEVLRACWDTFCGTSFRFGLDRLGMALQVYNKRVDEHFLPLLEMARNSNQAAFDLMIAPQGVANATQRDFVKMIEAKLIAYNGGALEEDALRRFLASLVILHFDFGSEGSRDYAYIVEVLRRLLPPKEHHRAPELFLALERYATAAKGGAGALDIQNLPQRLLADGFLLQGAAEDCHADLERLDSEADLALKEIRSEIEGLALPRHDLQERARQVLEGATFLLLTGPFGTGKSVLWKHLVSLARGQGPALVLSGDDLNRLDVTSWNGYATYLRLQHGLQVLLLALSSAPQPAVFIDGLDRVTKPGARRVVKDLLRTLGEMPLSADGSRAWKVVATARQENAPEVGLWLDAEIWQRFEELPVPPLEPEEVEQVVRSVPRLRPLLLVPSLESLLPNPFMLGLLADARLFSASGPLPEINTELDVCRVWWDRVVGLAGQDEELGVERQELLLRLGAEAAARPGQWISRQSIGTARAFLSLKRDGIVAQHGDVEQVRVRRDPLEEWVAYRFLVNSHVSDMAAFLASIEQPLGLYRSVQLVGAHLLERYGTAEEWARLLAQVEATPDAEPPLHARWRQAVLCAPLASTRAVELLEKAEPFLVENRAQRLRDLLTATRTVEVDPNRALARASEGRDLAPHELTSLAMTFANPRWPVWARLLKYLLPRLPDLPKEVRPEAVRILRAWQENTLAIPSAPFRRDIAEIAVAWLAEIEWRHDHDDFEEPDW